MQCRPHGSGPRLSCSGDGSYEENCWNEQQERGIEQKRPAHRREIARRIRHLFCWIPAGAHGGQ